MPRPKAPSLPQGRWRRKRKAGGGRSRARISASGCEAGFHETSMAGPRCFSKRGGPAEPAKVTGIAPWLELAGRRRKALRPSRDPRGFFEEASALEAGSWKAGRLQGPHQSLALMGPSAQRFSKGDRRGFGLDASLWTRLGPRLAPDPKRDAAAGFRSFQSDPTGIGQGLHGLCRDPPGPNGARASLRDRGERRASRLERSQSRPARDGLATQRRQSKLGQVGAGGDTGPHYDSGR
jgi:hypothetical protein